jgi:branched-chain amino acid transport system ATP-binding protein
VSSDLLLELEDVHLSFGGLHAVAGATFGVRRGSISALIGPNGAGKTTLFNVISGFYRADRGRILVDGEPIFRKSPHAITRLGLVRTFQITKVLGGMSVLDNMMLAAPKQPGESIPLLLLRPRAARRREAEVRRRALELLEITGLQDHAAAYADTLSGGQRKLLEFGRALMTEPKLVLLDEPMAGINPTLGRRLLDLVAELRETKGMTFLFVEHDLDVVTERAEHVVVMANGAVIAQGPPAIVRDPAVVDAYLGARHHEATG